MLEPISDSLIPPAIISAPLLTPLKAPFLIVIFGNLLTAVHRMTSSSELLNSLSAADNSVLLISVSPNINKIFFIIGIYRKILISEENQPSLGICSAITDRLQSADWRNI